MIENIFPFPEYRLSVKEKVPLELITRERLTSLDLLNFILRGQLPNKRLINIVKQVLAPDADIESLKLKFPEFSSYIDRIVRDGTTGLYLEIPSVKKLVDYIDTTWAIGETESGLTIDEPQFTRELINNFRLRKYRLKTVVKNFPGTLSFIFDSMNLTDQCRQLVMNDTNQGKIMYKLSNEHLDKDNITSRHAEINLLDVSYAKEFYNYIGMTFTKPSTITRLVTVFIVELPRKSEGDLPEFEIVFDNLEETEIDSIPRHFLDCITSGSLKSVLRELVYDVVDVELSTRVYNQDYVKYLLTDLSMEPGFRDIMFTEIHGKPDDLRITVRDPLQRNVIGRIDFQKKDIVFSSPKGFLETINLIGIMLLREKSKPSIDIYQTGKVLTRKVDEKGKKRKRTDAEPDADADDEDSLYMDVIEKRNGEIYIRKARFFDSFFNKVCNKKSEKPQFGPQVPDDNLEYFPPESLVKELEEKGVYEFPRYQEQRVRVQKIYEEEGGASSSTARRKKSAVKTLGKRRIPKSVRDEMAHSGNFAYIFDYFPCVGGDIMDKTERDYIFDETKDDITEGRVAKTQFGFFDGLNPDNEPVFRMGVRESSYSFLEAAFVASKQGSGTFDPETMVVDFVDRVISDPVFYNSCVSQFSDSTREEFNEYVSSRVPRFIDSSYLINAVSYYYNVNVVVMRYVDKLDLTTQITPYALYEFPHGIYPESVFEKLDPRKKTIILMRRQYMELPDQYDYLITNRNTLFDTQVVLKFLRRKMSILEVDTDKIVDKYVQRSEFSFGSNELSGEFQVTDSTGNTVGVMMSYITGSLLPVAGGIPDVIFIPVLTTSPRAVVKHIPTKPLLDLLKTVRPTVKDLMTKTPFGKFNINKVGVTKLLDREYVTSLQIRSEGTDYIILCYPHDDREQGLFRNVPKMETPDPYISNVFRKSTNKARNTPVNRIQLTDLLITTLLQILRLEVMERFVKTNSFDTQEYKRWRRGVLKIEATEEIPDINNVSQGWLYGVVRRLKMFQGRLPTNPLYAISRNTTLTNDPLKEFIRNDVVICYSQTMLERLNHQLDWMERLVPVMGIRNYVPNSLYAIQVLYERLFPLAQTPDALTGIGKEGYENWIVYSRGTYAFNEIQPVIKEGMFDNKSQKLIGFHGARGRGLWALKSRSEETGKQISINPTENDILPASVYETPGPVTVVSQLDLEKRFNMKRLV